MDAKDIHYLRNALTKLNNKILLARTFSTQPSVIQELDILIVEICALGDKLTITKEK